MIPQPETIFEADEAHEYADGYLGEARHLTVETAEDMEAAAGLREQIRAAERQAEAARETLKRPVLEEGRRIDGAFAPARKAFTDALALVDRVIRQYRQREEQRARAAEMEARRQAGIERQKLQRQAERAEAKGLTETADRLERAAESVPVPTVESRAIKPQGFVTKRVWRFEITDPAIVPDRFKLIDETAIRKVVMALGAEHGIAGVRAWQEEDYSSRGTRSWPISSASTNPATRPSWAAATQPK